MSYNSTQFFWFVITVNLHVVTSDSDEYTATISNTRVHSALPNAGVLYRSILFILTCIEQIYLLIKTLIFNFYVMLTVHLSIILDNDQLDTRLLYFTIHIL